MEGNEEMTDYEKLKSLLKDFGVKYEEEIDTEIIEYSTDKILCDKGKSIIVNEMNNDYNGKVTGYSMFFTTFDFTEEGKFIQMGAWE